MDVALQSGCNTGDDDEESQENSLVHSVSDGSANHVASNWHTRPWVAVAGLMMLGFFAGSTLWLRHNHPRVTSLSTNTIVMQEMQEVGYGDGQSVVPSYDFPADGEAVAEGSYADGDGDGDGDGESAAASFAADGETPAEGSAADGEAAMEGGYTDGEGVTDDGEATTEGGTVQQDNSAESEPEPMTQEEISDLVRQAGDEHGLDRGSRDSEYRSAVQHIFNGTHVAGDIAPGTQEYRTILDFIARHPSFKSLYHKPAFGPVILSKSAEMLRTTMEQQGFSHSTLYHGTKSAYVPTILSMGFMVSGGSNGGQAWHGTGIYACISLGHAQCYGGGESIIKMEAYWNPQNKSKYLRRVNHDSEVNDVFVITDPLLLIPVEVIECCPDELTCI